MVLKLCPGALIETCKHKNIRSTNICTSKAMLMSTSKIKKLGIRSLADHRKDTGRGSQTELSDIETQVPYTRDQKILIILQQGVKYH